MFDRLHRRFPPTGDDGSLLLAFVVIIMVTSLLFVVTGSVITGLVQARNMTAFAAAGQAADAAANNALVTANMQNVLPTSAHPRTGTLVSTGASYSWYATAVPGGPVGRVYTVHITARSGHTVRTFNDQLTGIASTAGNASNGAVSYIPTPGTGFVDAVFADTGAMFGSGVQVTSYDSTTGATNTGHGTVATNGYLTLHGTAHADRLTLYDYQAAPYPDRCTGAGCGGIPTTDMPPALDVSSQQANQFIAAALTRCAQAGNPPRAWIASQHGGVLTATGPGGACYASLDFNENTTVTATPGNPVILYVAGNITVSPGVTVNDPSGTATPSAPSLIVYTRGGQVSLGTGLAVDAPYTANPQQIEAITAYCAANSTGLAAQGSCYEKDHVNGACAGPAPIVARCVQAGLAFPPPGGVSSARPTAVAWALWAPLADCAGANTSTATVAVYGSMVCRRVSSSGGMTFHYDDALFGATGIPVGPVVWSLTSIQEG